MIKAKDPRLRRISVAYEGFIVPEGVPLPKYSQLTEALPVASLAKAAPSSPPVFQVEEEEEAEQEEEGSVDLASATDGESGGELTYLIFIFNSSYSSIPIVVG